MEKTDVGIAILPYLLQNGITDFDVDFWDKCRLDIDEKGDIYISLWTYPIEKPDVADLLKNGNKDNCERIWQDWLKRTETRSRLSREEELLKRIQTLEAKITRLEKFI